MNLQRPKSSNKTTEPVEYTCEAEIRERIRDSIASKAAALKTQPQGGDEMVERWIQFVIQRNAEDGKLMTPQQYSDWCIGRHLVPGDRAKFVGVDREETSMDGGRSMRIHGQIGTIADVHTDDEGSVITFYPDTAVTISLPNGTVTEKVVNYQVRVGTKAWLTLERIPL